MDISALIQSDKRQDCGKKSTICFSNFFIGSTSGDVMKFVATIMPTFIWRPSIKKAGPFLALPE